MASKRGGNDQAGYRPCNVVVQCICSLSITAALLPWRVPLGLESPRSIGREPRHAEHVGTLGPCTLVSGMISSGWLGSKPCMEECVTAAPWESATTRLLCCACATSDGCHEGKAADLGDGPISLP